MGIVNGGLPPFIRVELQVIRAKIITSQLCRPVMAMDLVGDGVMGIPCLTYYVYPLMALARDLLGIIITGDTFRAATMGDMFGITLLSVAEFSIMSHLAALAWADPMEIPLLINCSKVLWQIVNNKQRCAQRSGLC